MNYRRARHRPARRRPDGLVPALTEPPRVQEYPRFAHRKTVVAAAIPLSFVVLWILSLVLGPLRVLTADPAAPIRHNLDRLIGETGLDPLDPNHALTRYRILDVQWDPFAETAHVHVELTYADGSHRGYAIPVHGPPNNSHDGYTTAGWHYNGLARFFAEHRGLPGLPLASTNAPIQVGQPQRLPLHPVAEQLGAWLLAGYSLTETAANGFDRVRCAPDGQRFLIHTTAPGIFEPPHVIPRALWLVGLDGTFRQVTGEVAAFVWAPDGQHAVLVRPRVGAGGNAPYEIGVIDTASGATHVVSLATSEALATTSDGVYFVQDDELWRVAIPEQRAVRVRPLPDARRPLRLALTPGGDRIAYDCGGDLCLLDGTDEQVRRVRLGLTKRDILERWEAIAPPARPTHPQALELAWRPDGEVLAVQHGTTLHIISRTGEVVTTIDVGGDADRPQWFPDGRFLFLNTFPHGGRRWVVLDTTTGAYYDLSQPKWDAYASLMPDGKHVLAWTGRGGFWQVPLLFQDSGT